uniref:hypothetical protein n=1 Tax=Thaumasiovibrio occultus TaxID=1891184 RepID=UPI000B35BBCE|nr:hypothetical protein [Thaumasiovibrio occultus]
MNQKSIGTPVPRSAKADYEDREILLLAKCSAELRATYQIKMLAYLAKTRGKKLVLALTQETKLHSSLSSLISSFPELIEIERT